MSAERVFIAKQVHTKLLAVEGAIDQALAQAAEFTASLPQARMQAGFSAVVGQDVFDSLMTTLAALNEARGQIVETHNRLEATRIKMRMKPVGFGSACDKPHVHNSVTHGGLTLVESEAA